MTTCGAGGHKGGRGNVAAVGDRVWRDPDKRLVWIDLEFTGLDAEKDTILEAAVIVTDSHTMPTETFTRVVRTDAARLEAMGEWCQHHHGRKNPSTGRSLIDEALVSPHKLVDVESALFTFLDSQMHPNTKLTLAGSSIWKDRRFLEVHMPRVAALFHHCMVDVSTLMEISRLWTPWLRGSLPSRTESHRALDDIRESIGLMRFFRETLYSGPTGPSRVMHREYTSRAPHSQQYAPRGPGSTYNRRDATTWNREREIEEVYPSLGTARPRPRPFAAHTPLGV